VRNPVAHAQLKPQLQKNSQNMKKKQENMENSSPLLQKEKGNYSRDLP